ncbi:MAG: collagen-like protein [Gloeocapsa sp. DLM2.Bin57]|nr:MAG: collagen-like protein [Gloeocapsa sp. DLM2.Bin57]
MILAPGGRGGEPGEGGIGGQGCQCEQPFWTVSSCTGRPGQAGFNCTSVEFSCQDGKTGRQGRRGNSGRDGRAGSLTLINLDRPVNEDRAAATVSFTELKDRGFTLSRNRWETRTGAAELLAPGSIVAEQYIELVERIEKSVLLVWNAPQSFTPFAEQLATLELLDNQEVEIILPNDVWLEYAISEDNNLTELVVINAILRPQVLQLESAGISGNGENLILTVVDSSELSNLVDTEFAIIYRTILGDPNNNRRNRNSRTRFEGDIPPELITYQNNQFIINVGELPIDPSFLTPGTTVEISLIITRFFQDNFAVQELRVTETIQR